MVDYSKWDHIEVSDDEDDTHPNIDTPSLFRWRHRARLERMQGLAEKEANYKQRLESCLTEKKLIEAKKNELMKNGKKISEDLKNDEADIERRLKALEEEEKLLNKEKKHLPKNVDTLSKEKFSKSQINPTRDPNKPKDDEEIYENLQKFLEEHKKDAKHFGMLSKIDDTAAYLTEHPYLASEEAASYLCLWCVDLAVEEKFALLDRVAKQAVCLQFLLEIARSQKVHPRDIIGMYFNRIKKMDNEYQASFNNELEAFKNRVKERARVRIEEAKQKMEEDEKKARLGPGGLDPIEVLETLPIELQECFKTKNVEMLVEVLKNMKPEDADYHFRRCIDSGLWIPNKEDAPQQQEEEEQFEDIQESKPEEK